MSYQMFMNLCRRIGLAVPLAVLWSSSVFAIDDADLFGPAGSELFGSRTLVLPNGNYVVTDPGFDANGVKDVGAVHLYDGKTDTIISTLTGSNAGDQVGLDSLVSVGRSNFVAGSSLWNENRGAVTWIDGRIGLSGEVSDENSLVGASPGDFVGATFASGFGNEIPSITRLQNGHYVVDTSGWAREGVDNVGAATWGDGNAGVMGEVSEINSLVGSSEQDFIKLLRTLDNGNYLVGSSSWDSSSTEDVGAVAWASGTGGTVGEISKKNALVGSRTDDRVGTGIAQLNGGHYVVQSPNWNRESGTDVGAVTWGNGEDGSVVGVVSETNSLIGKSTFHRLGSRVEILTNGNYLVINREWDASQSALGVGAVAFGSRTGGLVGEMSAANSLVGEASNDGADIEAVGLANGHYVISMPGWDDTVNNFVDAGTVIWADGETGISGLVSENTQIVGNRDQASVGRNLSLPNITPLTNGNFVINSPNWVNGAGLRVGASTWVDGSGPATGSVGAANSLIGVEDGDAIGIISVALTNGNYVVTDDEGNFDFDHVTWGSGTAGVVGTVGENRGLVGEDPGAELDEVIPLTNGNYVVLSPTWDSGETEEDVGAITWGNGADGSTVGTVDVTNSLIGAQARDRVGVGDRALLWNGGLIQTSVFFSNGGLAEAGAISWISGDQPTTGVVGSSNSLIGSSANDQIGQYSLCFFVADPGCGTYGELPSGNILAASSRFDDGGIQDAGAVVYLSNAAPTTGAITDANAAIGTPPGGVGSLPPNILLTSCSKVPLSTTQNRVILLDLTNPPGGPGESRIIFKGNFEGGC